MQGRTHLPAPEIWAPYRAAHWPRLVPDPARPFDFLVDGELLRKTLGQHLLEHDISPVRVAAARGAGDHCSAAAGGPARRCTQLG